MLAVELDMANGPLTTSRGIGYASRDQWQAFHDSLLTYGGLKAAASIDQAYSTRILESVLKDGRLAWP